MRTEIVKRFSKLLLDSNIPVFLLSNKTGLFCGLFIRLFFFRVESAM
jgi:hypothetical protein